MVTSDEIRARLAAVGLTVTDAELARLAGTCTHLQTVLAGFVALGPARYEMPALRYGPPGQLTDWAESAE